MSALQENSHYVLYGRIIGLHSFIIPPILQDLLSCMKSVGMNPSEQELLDMINEVRQIVRRREGGRESRKVVLFDTWFKSNSYKNQQ